MGLFSKKDRVYPLTEAMRLLKTAKYAHYTTIPVGDGYKLVSEVEASKHVEQLKTQEKIKTQRQSFLSEMSGNSRHNNINYNDDQSAKGYKKPNSIIENCR